ncbi:hypothetical protein PLESTM_000175600 [Pleodorina starrii]|nr:hypothetical protein PLESTM_000175600 [Pleodorina starrii]
MIQRFSCQSFLSPHRADHLTSRHPLCRALTYLATRPQFPTASSPAALPRGNAPLAPTMDSPKDAPIRVFKPEEDPEAAEQCCETIGQGFKSEPNNDFFSDDPSRYCERWRAIGHNTLLRSAGVPLAHSLGGSAAGGPEHAAVALAYVYPDQKVPDDAPEPSGIIDLSDGMRPETIPVRDELLSYMSAKKTEFLQTHGSFEYVAFLATRPEFQGKGLGSRLLRYITDKADAAGRWSYLEATNRDNVRLYERHGFRQLETKVWTLESLPGKRVMLVLMARPPASSSSSVREAPADQLQSQSLS